MLASETRRSRPFTAQRSERKWRRIVVWSLALALIVLIGLEVALRALGAGDFPTTDASDVVGYIPTANQHGAFKNTNHWAFNERAIGVARPFKPTKSGILLIGDSIVNGGNPTDQPDRLGPQLEQQTGCPVWPMSAGSWALLNELAEIKANPDFGQLGTIVFVSNSGDFGEASVWRSEYTHPRSHPLWLTRYVFERLYWPVNDNVPSKHTASSETDYRRALAEFLKHYRGKVLFLLYPDLSQFQAGDAFFPDDIKALSNSSSSRIQALRLISDRRWGASLYRDMIHPNPAGNHVLAGILASRLGGCRSPNSPN